ncbi:MAG: hypothetical protein Q4Q07_10225 [Tissierellia bacterium]|nr:hypothetical protein [Tissierellia bacterium]
MKYITGILMAFALTSFPFVIISQIFILFFGKFGYFVIALINGYILMVISGNQIETKLDLARGGLEDLRGLIEKQNKESKKA